MIIKEKQTPRRWGENKRKAAALVTTLALLPVLSGCAGKQAEAPVGGKGAESSTVVSEQAGLTAEDGVLNVCVGASPNTMDPALNVAIDAGTIITHLFEGLYTVSETGEPVPAQAERCEISEDGLTYTFTLRKGLVWSDGTPVTSEDYVYSWRRLVDPASGNSYSYLFQGVAGFQEAIDTNDTSKLQILAPDETTLVVRLTVPDSSFLSMLSAPYFVPTSKKVVEEYGEEWAVSAETYIGNGPYVVKEWTPSSYMLLEKNELYWNAGAVIPPQIKFVFFSDHSAELTAFEAGELHFSDNVPIDEIGRLREAGVLKTMPIMGTYFLNLNTEAAPIDNPLVRKALTLALDREWICKQIGDSGEIPAGAFVPPIINDRSTGGKFRDTGEYYDPTSAGYEANVQAAKEALAQAGYPDGEGLPSFELLYVEGSIYQLIAEAIQSQWAEIGIKSDLIRQEWGTFLSSMQGHNFQTASLSWNGDTDNPMDFLSVFIGDNGNNFSGWANKRYDTLLKEVSETVMDEKTRYEKLHEAEDILMGEWVICPIYYSVDIYLQDPAVTGVKTYITGTKSFITAEFER